MIIQQFAAIISFALDQEFWAKLREFWTFVLFTYQIDGEPVSITVGLVLLVIIAFIFTGLFLRLLRRFVTGKLREDDKYKFITVFRFIQYFAYLVVILITLGSAGIDITILLTASAALFVGLGLALQELFQDLIGGIIIIIDKTLLVGDIIEMDGKVGRVFEIKLRTTRALTRDDKVMIIPNHKFISNVVYNYTQNHKTTQEFVKVGVAYGSDTQLVKKILLKCAVKNESILKSPEPFVMFDDFGDSAMQFAIHFYVTDSFVDPKIKSSLRFEIDEEFRKNNITIPFPQREVHMIYPKNQPKLNTEDE